ncbi:hypothetical protein [Streptomyces sp. Tu 6176]|nr:hypothetical protein [Streptomyces sp. Tu 6176]
MSSSPEHLRDLVPEYVGPDPDGEPPAPDATEAPAEAAPDEDPLTGYEPL